MEKSSKIVYQPPKEILVYLVNRKIGLRDVYFTEPSKYRPEIFGKPLFVLVNQ